ncbi:sensor histidine kinase [Neobacillus ginsengisoli]|uniref:histidine kinase n=1 Tax=Neobacillus ginsengisoli TaxID=904295 RepID=A0ABT9Y152_9BACI|nr:HAMP domain-containing sensor histidine kinase [Neobacillus ginsengisoli]MDQ0201476.1 K+-sensing histidine kinase KdpD [Neobacillus ginsengisoli]
MFRKTHLRLTFLNSLVFIVLIGILGSIVYFYTENSLYKDVNQSLLESARHFQQDQPVSDRNGSPMGMRGDPRIVTLLWNEKNNLLDQQSHDSGIFQDNEKLIEPKNLNTLKDVTIEGFSFRYISIEMYTSDSGKIRVQFIRNVNSEKELLNRLLLILLIGCGLGVICAVVSGYLLAGKSLIPIKNAWQKQQQFVSDASHELRTPLAVIQAKTDVLFRSPQASIREKIIDVSAISNESRRLSKLVANLLILARSDSNQIEIKKQVFRLDELLKNITQQFEDIATYQGKSIHLDVSESVLFLADQERIHQLIVILLDNAMKYTNEGGEICLSCHQIGSSITLRVKDTGIGIPEEDIPKIFDRFYQRDKVRTAGEGTGLGLSIAKWIIEQHQGKTKVQSIPGKGTTIEMIFKRQV